MSKRFLLLCALIFGMLVQSKAQVSVKDSVIAITMVNASFAFHKPSGDLADRFGDSNAIGLGALRKTKKNWIWGAELNFIIGSDIKDENIFDNITGGQSVIDANGQLATIRIFERGMYFNITGGKIIPVLGPNKNSGILITGGVGYMYHKIKIESLGNRTPQLTDELIKGYDRYTAGIFTSQFIGYTYLSNKRKINFFVGFDFIQGYTEDKRTYNYTTGERIEGQRNDLLWGFRIGWILPIYRKAPDDFYYF